MEHKGYLTYDYRVTRERHVHKVIGEITYKETRYNLGRVFVARRWAVTGIDGTTGIGIGATRREAIADFRREVTA